MSSDSSQIDERYRIGGFILAAWFGAFLLVLVAAVRAFVPVSADVRISTIPSITKAADDPNQIEVVLEPGVPLVQRIASGGRSISRIDIDLALDSSGDDAQRGELIVSARDSADGSAVSQLEVPVADLEFDGVQVLSLPAGPGAEQTELSIELSDEATSGLRVLGFTDDESADGAANDAPSGVRDWALTAYTRIESPWGRMWWLVERTGDRWGGMTALLSVAGIVAWLSLAAVLAMITTSALAGLRRREGVGVLLVATVVVLPVTYLALSMRV